MKINVGKEYKTVGGRKARVYQILDSGDIHGAIFTGDDWFVCTWSPDLKSTSKSGYNELNNIEREWDLQDEYYYNSLAW